MKNTIKLISILSLTIFLNSCKDEKLTLIKVPYEGNEIRIDGYYYSYYVNNVNPPGECIVGFFLYRNGIMLSARAYDKTDLDILEKNMLERYESLQEEKIGWGVFVVKENQLVYEQWSTSVGGGLPVFKSSYNIENDTTLINPYGEIYRFKQFSPKPDSTNRFIP